jgi:hypothetical protein
MSATGTDGDATGTPSAFVLVSTGTLTGTDGDAPPRGRTPPLSVGGVFVLDAEPEPWNPTAVGIGEGGPFFPPLPESASRPAPREIPPRRAGPTENRWDPRRLALLGGRRENRA